MFSRLQFSEWQMLVPLVAFLLTFAGFLVLCLRTWRMNPRERDHLAHLPLESDLPTPTKAQGNHPHDPSSTRRP